MAENGGGSDFVEKMEPIAIARRNAIDHLRRDHAKIGAVEASYTLDGSTGAVLEFVTGNKTSVNPDEAIIAGCSHAITLHSHSEDGAAGPDDWQAFIEQQTNREQVIVAPTKNFVLRKPPGWIPSGQWDRSPYDDWLDHGANVALELGFSPLRELDKQQEFEFRGEVNRRMARQYEITFDEETIS